MFDERGRFMNSIEQNLEQIEVIYDYELDKGIIINIDDKIIIIGRATT